MDLEEYLVVNKGKVLSTLKKKYLLSEKNSELVYLKMLGFSHEMVADKIKMSVSNVKRIVRDFRLRYDKSNSLNTPLHYFVPILNLEIQENKTFLPTGYKGD